MGALDEQRHGAELGGVLERRARGHRQRAESIDLLVATFQRLLRGHEQPYVRCAGAQ